MTTPEHARNEPRQEQLPPEEVEEPRDGVEAVELEPSREDERLVSSAESQVIEAQVIEAEAVDSRPSGGEGGPGAVTPPLAGDLASRLDRVEERLVQEIGTFRDQLQKHWELDRFRDDQVDRLHRELQEHKNDLLGRTLQPVFQGVIRLHGDLSKTAEALEARAPDELTPERFFRVLDGFREDLEILLDRHGVCRFENPGDRFDPARQTALRTEPAPRSEMVGQIVARIRPGFEQGDVLLRKEGVAVWASVSDAPVETADAGATQGPSKQNETEEL